MSQLASNSSSTTSRMARPIAAKPATPLREFVSGASFPTITAPILANLGVAAGSNGLGITAPVSPSLSMGSNSTGSRPFETKFSAATEMILKRIREGGPLNASVALGLGTEGGIQPPGYESVRRSVLQGMKTTLNMDFDAVMPPSSARRSAKAVPPKMNAGSSTPTSAGSGAVAVVTASTPTAASAPVSKGKVTPRTGKAKAGTKRKRAKDSESTEESGAMSDFSEDSDSESAKSVTNLPTKTLSGRKVVKPAQFDPAAIEGPQKKRAPNRRVGRNSEQVLCKRCGRGHSPASNMIVFCDGCNLGWHQMCHDPTVSDELVKDESREWFCYECSLKKAQMPSPISESKSSAWAGKSIEEVRYFCPVNKAKKRANT
jgi:PHD-finger